MKKIVALVLTLVLALSLSAIAFGTTFTAGKAYEYVPATGTISSTPSDVAYTAENTTAKTVAYYTIAAAKYIVCDAKNATYVVYTGSSWIYLKASAGVAYDKTAAVYAGKNVCGDYYTAAPDAKIYTVLNDSNKAEYYLAGNDGMMVLVDGKLVKLNATKMAPVAHQWVATMATDGVSVASYTCKTCKAAAKPATMAEYYAAAENVRVAEGENGLLGYAILTSAGTTDTGVTSPKTFDAGIAMYVGMSLMAVTGSAVVIGKKKEF